MLAIAGADRAHTLGVCAGGQLLAIAVAHLAAAGAQDRVASMTLPVCVIHHADPGSLTGFLNRDNARLAARGSQAPGGRDRKRDPAERARLAAAGRQHLVGVDAALFPIAEMPKMDLFYWSEDITNLPAGLVTDLLELTLRGALAEPGRLTVLGEPVDLTQVHADAYLIAGLTDHLTHWQTCYRTASMLGSDCEFILGTGGHLHAILQPPGGRAAGYRTAAVTARTPPSGLPSPRSTRQLVGALGRLVGRALHPAAPSRPSGSVVSAIRRSSPHPEGMSAREPQSFEDWPRHDRLVSLRGLKLFVRERGEGYPLLLINGIGANVEMWGPAAELLSQIARTIAFDARAWAVRERALWCSTTQPMRR